MKRPIFLLLLLISLSPLAAQQKYIDSLKSEIKVSGNDTQHMIWYLELADAYWEVNPDSSLFYADNGLTLSRKMGLDLYEAKALFYKGYSAMNMGNYSRSLQTYLSALHIAEDPKSEKSFLAKKNLSIRGVDDTLTAHAFRLYILSSIHQYMGILYENSNIYEKAVFHVQKAKQIAIEINDKDMLAGIYNTMGRLFLSLKLPDSALIYEQNAYKFARISEAKIHPTYLLNLGRIQLARGNQKLATAYFRSVLLQADEVPYPRGVVAANILLSDISKNEGKTDSGLYFANNAMKMAESINIPNLLLRSYTTLADLYKTSGRNDSAVKYQSLIIKINDSVFNSRQTQQFQNIDFDEQQRNQEIETARKTYRNRIQTYGLLSGMVIVILVAILLIVSNRRRQKAYLLLKQQKLETEFQKGKVELTLEELKSTQNQLIQSEKMASLGELAAGIAHEIQNPLNFVNNFSEVNSELILELEQEAEKGNIDEVKLIAKDIKENEQKISHHGKRADSIVKGMLQHSRSSTGKKEPADINALADEYLRLSYHGLRAKDKDFNSSMQTDFDQGISQINIISQDIGRVLLNLYNNAFYAVAEKEKKRPVGYEPMVSVRTKKISNKVEIRVKDNGNGIPQKVIEKIFQPFFTTKPTGQGTGLGLSLSYDIVKVHGGEISVDTIEGEYTEFIIKLPA